jgi:uncharacterized protein (TIGR03086 family)
MRLARLLPPRAPLPSFLIIGAQKSATRWLRYNLGLHPEVYAAPREISFFDHRRRFRRGTRWYRRQFVGWDGEKIVGEATPGYMMERYDPAIVARRIKRVVPDVRLIAVLRNPVDRAQSALLHHMRRRRIPASTDLVELVRRESDEAEWYGLVSSGRYWECLHPYRRRFGDQLLVLLHDDVVADPRSAYERALEHIGAAPAFVPDDLDAVRFSYRDKWPEEHDPPPVRPLTSEERVELFEYFRDDVARLQRMIGRDLGAWVPEGADPLDPAPLVLMSWAAVNDLFASLTGWVSAIIGSLRDDDLGNPTPCHGWDVRTVVQHLVGGTVETLGLPESPGSTDLDETADSLAMSYASAVDGLCAHVAAAGAVSCVDGAPPSEDRRVLMFPAWRLFVEHAVHGWDIATATGTGAEIPDAVAAHAEQLVRALRAMAPPRPGRFAPEVAVRTSATPTERLVALLGRDPATNRAPV